ncbi:MAG: TetR/AcrR family transcriptional regulator, partial [Vicinamibacteria bacterium]
MPGRPARKAAYHHGDLRRELLDQALRLVDEKGPAALTLRETARRAGVTEAAPYRHFRSKDALVAALAAEGFQSLFERTERALARAGAVPRARLIALGTAYVRLARDRPAHFHVMFGREIAGSHGFREVRAAAQACFAALLREVADAQRAGTLRGRDPRGPARARWCALHGHAALQVEGRRARPGWSAAGPRGAEALAR